MEEDEVGGAGEMAEGPADATPYPPWEISLFKVVIMMLWNIPPWNNDADDDDNDEEVDG